ncbi:MAG: hypothetical protein BWY67_01949 [Bacteroidetes bacterium ADurb.Bin397]|nr:MAG: hypothetical protein BWY67_01949 [Bacteroidetes bacterium ADurb.Bin397]
MLIDTVAPEVALLRCTGAAGLVTAGFEISSCGAGALLTSSFFSSAATGLFSSTGAVACTAGATGAAIEAGFSA